MSYTTVGAACALAVCAFFIGTIANSQTAPKPSISVTEARSPAPAVTIDIFELMGRAFGELPVETANSH